MIKQLVTPKHILFALALAVAVSGLSGGQEASAAESMERSSIALSPVSQRFEVSAGETAKNTVTVINDGTQPSTFLVYSRPYSVKNEVYEPDFQSTNATTDVYQWLRFGASSYTLGAGERIDVPYTLQVPSTATPGGHYGVIFVETQPTTETGNSVVRKKRVGSIIQVNVDGSTIRKGALLTTNVDFWQTIPPLAAASRVENTGNTDFQVGMTLTVTDVFGNIKHRAAQDFTVYPGTVRRITTNWTDAPWFGLFKAQQTVNVLDKVSSETRYVLMAPRWLLVIVLVFSVIGVGYALLRRKRAQ